MVDQILPGFRLYQSANTSNAEIRNNFIVRLHEFDIIINDIRRNPMKGSVQHFLLLGRRGSGKSTLLRRIQEEIETDNKLNKHYIAVNLAEEQADIYRLFDLWEKVLESLKDTGAITELPKWENNATYVHLLAEAIHKAVLKSQKKVILLLDNIDRIFENLAEQASMLREYLLNFDDIKIIGGSTRMTEDFWHYNKPFYEFFRVLELKPLTSDEVMQLLQHWSNIQKLPELASFIITQKGQIEAIRILTDGLPRTLQFFVSVLLKRKEQNSYEYLRQIMDYVTPLYQERLNHLPPPHRKIILQMAFFWEAVGTKQIAEACRLDNKLVSANLKQLIGKGIVQKLETNSKNHLYRLSERFFNLWLIFTQGSPIERKKARCLTIFLENFYSANDIRRLTEEHLKLLDNNISEANHAALFTKALAHSKYISALERDKMIEKTLALDGINRDVIEQMPEKTAEIIQKAEELIEQEKYKDALKTIENIEQDDAPKHIVLSVIYKLLGKNKLSEESFMRAIADNTDFLFLDKGHTALDTNKNLLAELYYLLAAENGNTWAMDCLGDLYNKQNKPELAEKYYRMSAENGSDWGMYDLGHFYDQQNKPELAEKYYRMSAENGSDWGMYDLGHFYDQQNKPELAEKYYRMSIENGNNWAMCNLGHFYDQQNKPELAEKYYRMSIENGNDWAMYDLGGFYDRQNKPELAEKYYRMSAEKDNDWAMYKLGLLYLEQNKTKLAEKYLLMSIENENIHAIPELANFYLTEKRNDLAEKYFLLDIEKNGISSMEKLVEVYYSTGINKKVALELLEKYNKTYYDTGNMGVQLVLQAWNGVLGNLEQDLVGLISDDSFADLQAVFTELLVHQQKNLIKKMFHHDQYGASLKEKLLPLYYVTELLTGVENNIELKIPPELQESINEIIEYIKEKRAICYPEEK